MKPTALLIIFMVLSIMLKPLQIIYRLFRSIMRKALQCAVRVLIWLMLFIIVLIYRNRK